MACNRQFYSLEFFPPHTVEGARSLVARMDRLASSNPPPLSVDITWTLSAGKRSFETLVAAKAVCALDVQMHLTCTGITRRDADDLLAEAAKAGILSILVLRGDPPPAENAVAWEPRPDGFQNAGELVEHIRRRHGRFFSIGVAGHPLGHPMSTSRADELQHLKRKVDAGADYIVTQMFFKASDYLNFVKECRAVGITCPIVAGILMVGAHCRPGALVHACVCVSAHATSKRELSIVSGLHGRRCYRRYYGDASVHARVCAGAHVCHQLACFYCSSQHMVACAGAAVPSPVAEHGRM